jgi:polar amino acid transport system permease protein
LVQNSGKTPSRRAIAGSRRDEPHSGRIRFCGGNVTYKFDFGPVWAAMPQLLAACLGTLGLAVAGSLLAIVIGIGGVILRDSRFPPLRWLVMAFVELIRNTPFLVQIYFIFFALPLLGDQLGQMLAWLGVTAKPENILRIGPWPTAVIALGLNGGAYAIEIIRGGVQSVPKGQWEAGLALGLHRASVFRLIILKPALRAIYPSLTSQFTLLTLTTSIAGAIAAYELFSEAKFIDSQIYKPFEVYFTITIFYFVISWLMNRLFQIIADRSFSYPVK